MNNFDHSIIIKDLAMIIHPELYVELGLYQCDVFNQIIPYAKKLIGVDTQSTCQHFMSNSHNTSFFNGSTDDFFILAKAQNLQIDMIFIDADHAYESVLKDFYNAMSLTKENGLIILHDSYPADELCTQKGYCDNAYKAIEILSKNNEEYEMMTIPVHPGLTLCRKRRKHLPWTM